MSRVQAAEAECHKTPESIKTQLRYMVVDYYGNEHWFHATDIRHGNSDADYWYTVSFPSLNYNRWINHVKVIRGIATAVGQPPVAMLVEFKHPAVDTGIQRIWVRAEDLVVE